MTEWADDQAWESDWWGDCSNTFGEETKQITYAHRMGLVNVPRDGHWPAYDLSGRSVVDIGGGPVSILLKTFNVTAPTVVDPCVYPKWVADRYGLAGITQLVQAGETLTAKRRWDEAWIYNVLQHVQDPEAVVDRALRVARVVRIFEWMFTPPHTGHPHTLFPHELDKWLHGTGATEEMNENGATGTAYYGVFPS